MAIFDVLLTGTSKYNLTFTPYMVLSVTAPDEQAAIKRARVISSNTKWRAQRGLVSARVWTAAPAGHLAHFVGKVQGDFIAEALAKCKK